MRRAQRTARAMPTLGNIGNNSTSYTGIGQNSANNVGSTQIGQGNVNAASQIQQGNNTGAYIQQAGSLATDPAIMGWFQKHWFGQANHDPNQVSSQP
jgi:hypothetical protein